MDEITQKIQLIRRTVSPRCQRSATHHPVIALERSQISATLYDSQPASSRFAARSRNDIEPHGESGRSRPNGRMTHRRKHVL
jgi:hypothetical protein